MRKPIRHGDKQREMKGQGAGFIAAGETVASQEVKFAPVPEIRFPPIVDPMRKEPSP